MGFTVLPDEPTWRDFSSHLASTTGRRATHRRAQRLRQFLGDRDILFFLDAATDGYQYRVLGDIDVAGLGDDGLEIAASGR